MTRNRLTLILLLSALVAYLYRVASRRETIAMPDRDELLLGLDEYGAYQLGYTQGLNGIEGYWPETERETYDVVPDVGVVWRATPQERAYWRGWYAGEAGRDRANA